MCVCVGGWVGGCVGRCRCEWQVDIQSLTREKKGCSLISETGLVVPSLEPHPIRKSGSRLINYTQHTVGFGLS